MHSSRIEPQRVLEDARARDRERRAGAKPGPLFGLPIPVKDSVNTRDYPTTGGTPALRNFRPKEDAPLVARAAGGRAPSCSAKRICTNFPTAGPATTRRTARSTTPMIRRAFRAAAAAARPPPIAARLAPLGVAEDTEGSIRVPAALCGIAGFRPTTGRYSTQGCVPISPLFDQVGPLARTVADLALFDAAVTGEARPPAPGSLRGVRLGVVRDYWFTDLDPEVERITESRLGSGSRAAGAELVETQMPGLAQLIDLTTDQVQNHDVRIALPRYLEEYGAGVTFRGADRAGESRHPSGVPQRRAAGRRQFRVRIRICSGARSIPAGTAPAVSGLLRTHRSRGHGISRRPGAGAAHRRGNHH